MKEKSSLEIAKMILSIPGTSQKYLGEIFHNGYRGQFSQPHTTPLHLVIFFLINFFCF